MLNAVLTLRTLLLSVWPLPRSLATTSGISFDFSSSPYLDVSVQAVPLIQLWIHCMIHRRYPMWIAPFGHLRINVCLQLPAAFRSLPRPSSASGAKAFPLCSFLLDRLIYLYISECSSDTTFLFYCSMCFYLCLTLFLFLNDMLYHFLCNFDG